MNPPDITLVNYKLDAFSLDGSLNVRLSSRHKEKGRTISFADVFTDLIFRPFQSPLTSAESTSWRSFGYACSRKLAQDDFSFGKIALSQFQFFKEQPLGLPTVPSTSTTAEGSFWCRHQKSEGFSRVLQTLEPRTTQLALKPSDFWRHLMGSGTRGRSKVPE
ncbi:MAG: hypothetical protein U5O39_04415 [Gammaproteobacteria bacterium]|nr:hypothetical protein [Gammaproteobacteria bacterium]